MRRIFKIFDKINIRSFYRYEDEVSYYLKKYNWV